MARGLQGPFFALAGKPLVLFDAWGLSMVLTLVGIAVATGVLSGLYPALMLSGFQPARALKGTLRSGPAAIRLRQGLVVAQFGAAVLLLAGAAIVYVQVEFLKSAPLGFEKEHILAIESVPRDWSPEGVARLQRVKERLEAVPGVRAVSLSWETAAEDSGNTFPLRRVGQPLEEAMDVTRFVIDEDFSEVYGLRLVDGTFLDNDATGVLLNEQAALSLGIERAGQSLVLMDSLEVEVRGIVRDFHYASLHEPIRPLVMVPLAVHPLYRTFSLRFTGGGVTETLRRAQAAWHEMLPEAPFDYTFVDDQIAANYVTERRTGMVVGLAAMLAVLVAGLGVFGLVSISVFQRRREIGVRKVLGASAASLVGMFAGHFAKLALAGSFVAVPLAYWLSQRWLEAFAYRIDIGPAPFLLAVGLVLGLALALVAIQAVRAATADPIRALRSE
jgi:putative ABC transport system permease protein